MAKKPDQTYDYICFSDLVYERETDSKDIEKKIKRRLKYHNLGTFNPERMAYIRHLRDDLDAEISLQEKSNYYQKSDSNYAELSDFNLQEMILEYLKTYPKIDRAAMSQMITFAIYIYYIR